MLKLQRHTSKRELREVMLTDILRPTRHKIMSRRGRNFKKWVGLPKPASNAEFHPLPMVTSGIVHKYGKVAGEGLAKRYREFRISDRAAVVAYLANRKAA